MASGLPMSKRRVCGHRKSERESVCSRASTRVCVCACVCVCVAALSSVDGCLDFSHPAGTPTAVMVRVGPAYGRLAAGRLGASGAQGLWMQRERLASLGLAACRPRRDGPSRPYIRPTSGRLGASDAPGLWMRKGRRALGRRRHPQAGPPPRPPARLIRLQRPVRTSGAFGVLGATPGPTSPSRRANCRPLTCWTTGRAGGRDGPVVGNTRPGAPPRPGRIGYRLSSRLPRPVRQRPGVVRAPAPRATAACTIRARPRPRRITAAWSGHRRHVPVVTPPVDQVTGSGPATRSRVLQAAPGRSLRWVGEGRAGEGRVPLGRRGLERAGSERAGFRHTWRAAARRPHHPARTSGVLFRGFPAASVAFRNQACAGQPGPVRAAGRSPLGVAAAARGHV